MGYFSRFPFIKEYKIQGKAYTGMDITRRTGIRNKSELGQDAYLIYTVGEGETPEMLADRLYDDPDMFWVIMMFNDSFDIDSDWPLTQLALDQYVQRVYDDPNAIHHYESAASGAWVDGDLHPDHDLIPVTNYEYEIDQNDKKRYIKVPTPQYAATIISEHNRLIQQ